jgi:hypothetical protein
VTKPETLMMRITTHNSVLWSILVDDKEVRAWDLLPPKVQRRARMKNHTVAPEFVASFLGGRPKEDDVLVVLLPGARVDPVMSLGGGDLFVRATVRPATLADVLRWRRRGRR